MQQANQKRKRSPDSASKIQKKTSNKNKSNKMLLTEQNSFSMPKAEAQKLPEKIQGRPNRSHRGLQKSRCPKEWIETAKDEWENLIAHKAND